MNRINFDLIVTELKKGLRDHEDRVVQACGFFKRDDLGDWRYCGVDTWYFKEFRTIGLTVPRQTGKTHWVANELIMDHEACAIVRDDATKRFFEQFFQDHQNKPAYDRVFSTGDVRQGIAKGALPKYRTYYVDDARHTFHFIERLLHQYFIETEQLAPTIILVN